MPDLSRWLAERAWVGEVAERVLIEVDGERIVRVERDVASAHGASWLAGFTIPGMANAHSHAFHRALRGRTHRGAGDFWTWREQMYRVADALDPESYLQLARATYAEMALAGVTAVGEFHYLHHAQGGRPYDDPNAMGIAVIQAAADAGIRITLLDTCYLHAGLSGVPLEGPQLRFGDGDAVRWAERVNELAATAAEGGYLHARIGAAVHSVRAVDPESMTTVARWAHERSAPLHLHLSEQRAENEACVEVTGRTPTELVEDNGVLGSRTTAVHATHLVADDIERLGASATAICMCPTTERDLADGIGPARLLADAGSPLCVGSDSHAVIDLLEEARAIELDERLATERRGGHQPAALLEAATAGGMASLGWDAGRIAAGALADFVTVGFDSPRMAGADADPLGQLVFAAAAADVRNVVVGGRTVVENGRHVLIDDVAGSLSDAVRV